MKVKLGQKWRRDGDEIFTVYRINGDTAFNGFHKFYMYLRFDGTVEYARHWTYIGIDTEYNPCLDCGMLCLQKCKNEKS